MRRGRRRLVDHHQHRTTLGQGLEQVADLAKEAGTHVTKRPTIHSELIELVDVLVALSYKRSSHATGPGDNTPRIMPTTGEVSHAGTGDRTRAAFRLPAHLAVPPPITRHLAGLTENFRHQWRVSPGCDLCHGRIKPMTRRRMTPKTPIVPPLDPELAPVLDTLGPLAPKINAENLATARAAGPSEILGAAPDLTAGGAVRIDELTVPGPEGAPQIALTILRPTQGEGPWPVLYNTHGGGMVMGDRTLELPFYLKYVAEGLAAIVAVEYRLAPEHPDPAPIEDCYAGLVWTANNAEDLSLDPARILVVGTSAGGGLAAGVALLSRDRGFPALTHQILYCPMLDDRGITASSQMLVDFPAWDRDANLFGWTSLLGDRRGGNDVSIYAAPARADDLSGLPKTYIDVGTVETFRDEVALYAQRLAEAGVSVDFHMWAGAFHSFELIAPHAAISQAAEWVKDDFMRRALTSGG